MPKLWFVLPLLSTLTTASYVWSQPAPDQTPDQNETVDTDNKQRPSIERKAPEESVSSDQPALESSGGNNVEELKKQISSMQEHYDTKLRENASIKEQYDAKFREYEARLEASEKRIEELELEGFEEEALGEETKEIRINGFFDTTFYKSWVNEENVLKSITIDSPMFIMQNFNLYFANQMTEQISFVGELRFTFLPNGEGSEFFPDTPRTDSTVADPSTEEAFRLGGVAIERVYLKWAPWDFFGVVVGYYLTPYGIWHLDHGSPNRLSILHPLKINTLTPAEYQAGSIIVDAQLGIQLLGRVFPMEGLYFDYAFTVSNGRGPADTVIDYDDNKATGLRLKLTYETPDFIIALGGYGYYGTYTDKVVEILAYETVAAYSEHSIATDFLIGFYGLRLQGEFIHSLVTYSDSVPRPSYVEPLNYIIPDHIRRAAYAMLAYELPLANLLNGMTLTPYFAAGFEHPISGDWVYSNSYWGGLNFKPSPWITIKTEMAYTYCNIKIALDMNDPTMWTWRNQLAVSF